MNKITKKDAKWLTRQFANTYGFYKSQGGYKLNVGRLVNRKATEIAPWFDDAYTYMMLDHYEEAFRESKNKWLIKTNDENYYVNTTTMRNMYVEAYNKIYDKLVKLPETQDWALFNRVLEIIDDFIDWYIEYYNRDV